MNYSIKKPFLGVLIGIVFLLAAQISKATHLRAGEIIATKLSTYTYEFTLTLYRNTLSTVEQPTATFTFSDGTSQTVNVLSTTPLQNNTDKLVYKVQKTFSGASTYTVGFMAENRNANILNMQNSVNTPFYVESQIVIDPLGGANTTPQFLYPPIDKGNQGQIYTHSPAAYDLEGDSLSFGLVSPESDKGTVVTGYLLPSQVAPANGNTTFKIDSKTGLITWDRPLAQGLYNIAFRVYEWRNGYQIGYVTRDMQIIIGSTLNRNPDLLIPNDTCITAGKVLTDTIIAFPGVGNETHAITAFSGVFSLPSPGRATTFLSKKNLVIDSLFFRWQTSCALIQAQPYQVTFKAENRIGQDDALSTLKVWQIKIIPPAFENLRAVPTGRTMNLSWDAYSCTNTAALVILRKDCSNDTSAVEDSCSTGNNYPDGYKFIKRLARNATSFVDDNFGKGLDFETQYCYYVYAEFPAPQKGYSRASALACASIDNEVPLIIGASVLKTDSVKGKVEIKWTKPTHLKSTTPPPYQLRVFRIEGNTISNILARNYADSLGLVDTLFVDSTANTKANNLSYYIEFYANSQLVYTSKIASTVLLKGIGRNQKTQIEWSFNTPWTSDTTFIYRSSEGDPDFIDTVYNDKGYIDNNLQVGKIYTYYVKTKGSFGCNRTLDIKDFPYPLYNLSQTLNIVPTNEANDTTRPCPPTIFINSQGSCEEGVNFSNTLNWTPNYGFLCDSNIVGYKLYKRTSPGVFTLYLNNLITNTYFDGEANKAVSGCFAVTAVNSKGLESDKSNIVCSDSCYFFQLPNIFTPNHDTYNDTFTPIPFPRNIEKVKFTVYNRWGSEIFYTEDDININWTGENVPDALYYYKAEITIGNFSGSNEKKVLKGWVQIAR